MKEYDISGEISDEHTENKTGPLRVKMLGEFSIRRGDTLLRDTGSRSYKTWLLLAYILCNHDRMIESRECIRMLEDHDHKIIAENSFWALIFRIRRALSRHFGEESCLIRRDGMYGWNPDVAIELDLDVFEKLCGTAAQEGDTPAGLDAAARAVTLYQGECLPKYSYEPWVSRKSAYYLNLLSETALRTASFLNAGERHAEAAKLCRNALRQIPFHEELVQELMRSLLPMGEYDAAIEVYDHLCAWLRKELDVLPDAETEKLYLDALRRGGTEGVLSIDDIKAQLREISPVPGPLICGMGEMAKYYQAEARSCLRRGESVHLALLSLSGKGGKNLSERSTDYAMEKLRQVLMDCLRTGDIAAQCSPTQYVVMLIQANYENCVMICERISRAFVKACPWTSALLQTAVTPLEVPALESPDPDTSPHNA